MTTKVNIHIADGDLLSADNLAIEHEPAIRKASAILEHARPIRPLECIEDLGHLLCDIQCPVRDHDLFQSLCE